MMIATCNPKPCDWLLRPVPDVRGAPLRSRILAVFTTLTLVAQGALAGLNAAEDQYTFTRLVGPDRGMFLPHAINAKGQIVGECDRGGLGDSIRAALRDVDGRFSIIEHPDGRFTRLCGINARGQIVGSAVDAERMFGFVREPDGRFIRLRLGVPDPRPLPVAINDQGVILGTYLVKGRNPRGFLRREDGEFRTLSDYGSNSYLGLNSRGQVVGHFLDLTGTRHGILLDEKDKVTLIDSPKTTLTEARAINDQGVIVGVYLNLDPHFGLHRSFVRDTKGKLAPFDFPGAKETQVTGINNAGQIVGRSEGREGIHGFLAFPKGRP
jgi:uncharacterized membrane protein